VSRSHLPHPLVSLTTLILLAVSPALGANLTPSPDLELQGVLFASTPVQILIDDPLVVTFGDFDLAPDVDVVSIHQDFLGIPWDAFADGVEPPEYWTERIDRLLASVDTWDRPVYLSLALVGGAGRTFLDARALEGEDGLTTDAEWAEQCINLETHPDGGRWRHAYLRYVEWMVEAFDPAYLTIGIEVNLFQVACDGVDPGAYDALIDLCNEAYAAVKSTRPQLPVFPSIQIDALMEIAEGGACHGVDPTPCIEHNLGRNQGMLRDRFAISAYPHLLEPAMPIDLERHIEQVLDHVPAERPVFAETGYNSAPLVVNGGTAIQPQCLEVYPYSAERQQMYLEVVVDLARRHDMDLVTWWSNRDVLAMDAYGSCPCEDEGDFCELLDAYRDSFHTVDERLSIELLFKGFSAMGIREHDGTPKPILERWQELRAEERARDRLPRQAGGRLGPVR